MEGSSSVAAGGHGGHGVPAGFKFKPTDEVLVLYYLTNYVSGQPSPPTPIRIGNVYTTEPWNLLDPDETVAYFLTPRMSKGSSKASRVAGSGSWRMERKDNVYDGSGNVIAHKGTFSFHAKKQRQSTGWVMHEYVLGSKEEDCVKFKEVGLCRIQRRISQDGEDKQRGAKRIKVTSWTPEDPSTSHRTTVLCPPDRPSIVVPPSSTRPPLECVSFNTLQSLGTTALQDEIGSPSLQGNINAVTPSVDEQLWKHTLDEIACMMLGPEDDDRAGSGVDNEVLMDEQMCAKLQAAMAEWEVELGNLNADIQQAVRFEPATEPSPTSLLETCLTWEDDDEYIDLAPEFAEDLQCSTSNQDCDFL